MCLRMVLLYCYFILLGPTKSGQDQDPGFRKLLQVLNLILSIPEAALAWLGLAHFHTTLGCSYLNLMNLLARDHSAHPSSRTNNNYNQPRWRSASTSKTTWRTALPGTILSKSLVASKKVVAKAVKTYSPSPSQPGVTINLRKGVRRDPGGI